MKIVDQGYIYNANQSPAKEKVATFPSLTTMANGDIFCSFRVGPEKNSPFDKIKLRKSSDNGDTWQDVIENFDIDYENVHGSGHNGPVGQISPDELLISYTWVDRSDKNLPFVHPKTTGLLLTKLLTSCSPDGGKTWTPLSQVDTAHHQAVASTDKPLRLNNGNILLPYESWKTYEQVHGFHSSACLLSTDKGQSWSRPIVIAEDPTQHLYFYDSRPTVAPDTGKIVDLLWTFDSTRGIDAPIHIHYGRPDGLEWTYPKSTGIQGQIASPLALGSDKLLMTYVHRHDPPSLRVLLSHDFGITWETRDELEIYRCGSQQAGMGTSRSESESWDDMARWTFGHPCSLLLPDDIIFLGFYAGSKQSLNIQWAKIKF